VFAARRFNASLTKKKCPPQYLPLFLRFYTGGGVKKNPISLFSKEIGFFYAFLKNIFKNVAT
jgi:hypothetical protein